MGASAFGTLSGLLLFGGPFMTAVVAVEDRNPVPPPELTADAPVAQVVHPGVVAVDPVRWEKFRLARVDLFDRPGRDLLFDEPLLRDIGFDDIVTAITVAHLVGMLFDLFDETLFFQPLDDFFPGIEPFVSLEFAGELVQDSLFVEDRDEIEIVAFSDLVVIRIVGRCDFDDAGSELHVDMFVGDDGNLSVDQREAYLFPDEMFVAFVVGMDHDGRIAEVGFGPRRRDHDIPLLVDERIADMVEPAFVLFVFDFDVAQCPVVGTPVDHVVAPDDQFFIVELDEGFSDGVFEPFVHRESLAAPGGGDAQFSHLVDDHSAAVLFPFPDPLQEGFASQLLLGLPFGQQLLFDDVLGRDAGMVGSRLPECPVAVHPLVADHDVLQGECQGMPDMKAPRHIRRRHHDAEILPLFLNGAVTVDLEISALFPDFIKFLFKGVGIVPFFLTHKTTSQMIKVSAIIAN